MQQKTMRVALGLAFVAIVAFSGAEDAAAAWRPPIGIPTPLFGINETAPPPPDPWNTPTPGFYYVDSTHASATDSGNPYGTPARPRGTIPLSLPAGAVVEVHGTYDQPHSSPRGITASGTAARPVFIRGSSPTTRPKITGGWQLKGSYYILENLAFADRDGTMAGKLFILAPTDHAALRHSEVSGNLKGGGVGVVSWTAGQSISHVVIYDNYIHDNGDVHASGDQDVHGIAVGAHVSNLWIVDNEIARSSGDGVQINGGSGNAGRDTHHIYLGRNVSHHNKQTGLWTKQAADVIFSQNTIFGHRPSNSSYGAGMGLQYAPDYAWFLFNHVYDNECGICPASGGFGGTGTELFLIGNLIHNIHPSSGFDPNNPHASAALSLRGGVNRYVVNNTIWNYHAGIMAPGGVVHIANNILGGRTDARGRDILIEGAATASTMDHNLLSGSPVRIQWGSGIIYDLSGFQRATGKGQNSLQGDPEFVNQPANDYRLRMGSPAIDAGIRHPVYAVFLQRYGIDSAKDMVGTPRLHGPQLDLGAYADALPEAPALRGGR